MPRGGAGEVMREQNCTNCRHYRAEQHEDSVLDFGECRKYPPALVVIEDQPASMFPQVDQNDYCSKWAPNQ